MNSVRARVTAAFLVRSPLTSTAFSKSLGSMDRLVAMCQPPHIILHTAGQGSRIRLKTRKTRYFVVVSLHRSLFFVRVSHFQIPARAPLKVSLGRVFFVTASCNDGVPLPLVVLP